MPDPEHEADARRWLRYAGEDLSIATLVLEQPSPVAREACWLEQQATEKALKAFLVFLEIDFRRTHDLDALRDLLPATSLTSARHPDLGALTNWAIEARYPGDWSEPTLEEAHAAVSQAEQVLASVRIDLLAQGIRAPNFGV